MTQPIKPYHLVRPEPVVVMVHYDLDAAGASVLLDYSFNVAGRTACGYAKFRATMERLRQEYPTINTVVMADLAVPPEDLRWALEHWDHVVYYDHHEASAQYAPLAEAMPDRFTHNFSIEMSATALVYKDFIEQGNPMTDELMHFVQIINTYDMWFKGGAAFNDGVIMNGIFWDLHMDLFRERFKNGFTGFTPDELKQAEARRLHEAGVVEEALKEKLESGSQIVMISEQSAINAVSTNLEGDIFYVMYYNEKAKDGDNPLQMSVRCKDEMPEVNLNMAMEELCAMGDYDHIIKTGGGHANAIGVQFAPNVDPNAAADFIMEVLDPRVRNW
jgi:oligoribonuclease NrnB/cAMP/cGMP phosphodiesterase (DHH superfamily)